MGDEQHRGSQGIGQHVQMVEDLLLHGHVERGGRLVGDEQFRTAGQTDGDQRALAHAAGEFVRELAGTGGGVRQAGLGQQTGDAVVHGGADHILLGDVPCVIVLHTGFDQAISHTPAGFGSRNPFLGEPGHDLVKFVTALADLDKSFLGCGGQIRQFLGAEEGLVVIALELYFVVGQSLGEFGTLFVVDVHVVGHQRFLDLGADAPHRVQVAHRILRDKTHLAATELVEVLLLEAGNLLSIKLDGAADNMAGSRKQAKHGHGGGGLAGTGFADDGHPLTRIHTEGRVAHGMHGLAFIGGEVDLKVLDLQQRPVGALHGLEVVLGIHFSHRISLHLHSGRTALRIERVLDGVTHHDECQHGDGQCGGRVEQHHRVGTQNGLRVGDVSAPADRGGGQTNAQEAQRGLEHDVGGQRGGADHDDRGQRIRQDVTEQVADRGGSQCGGCRVEFEVLGFHHRASRDSCHGGPAEQRHHQDDLPDGAARLEHLEHHDGAKQNRQREEDISQSAQHGVDPSSEEACDCANQRSEQHHQQCGEHADAQRGAGAVDHTGVNIATLQVEAERMASGSRIKGIIERAVVRVLLGQYAREQRHEHDEDNQQSGDDEQRVLTQGAPRIGPHA